MVESLFSLRYFIPNKVDKCIWIILPEGGKALDVFLEFTHDYVIYI